MHARRKDVVALAAIGVGSLAAMVGVLWLFAGVDSRSLPAALVAFAVAMTIVFACLDRHPLPRFGRANTVTVARAALVAFLFGLLFDASTLLASGATAAWLVTAVAAFALALDGVDGYIARRWREESAFGARFDMEVDAALGLVLALFVFLSGKAGLAVLALGSLRYVYMALLFAMPSLAGDLPPSMRRKTICVVQIGVLCALTAPIVGHGLAAPLAHGALALLAYSFAADIVILVSRNRTPTRAAR